MARISAQDSHFYLPHWISWDALKTLHEWHARRGPAADHRYYTNSLRHAWECILHVYFPSHYDQSQLEIQPDGTAQGIKYLLLRKFFDAASPPDDYGTGEGITLERITVDLPERVRHIRDILWVQCSPPSTDGTKWASAMQTTVAHLRRMHPARALYFILAVGMHWLPFYWDPNNPRSEGRGLKMAEVEGEEEGWYAVSPEVLPPPGVDAGHVGGEGVIHVDRARTLDCFTGAGPSFADERPKLTYQEDLDFLEEFLGVVARHAYVGEHGMSLG